MSTSNETNATPGAVAETPEARLEQANHAFGEAFVALAPELRARVAEIHQEVSLEFEASKKANGGFDPTTAFSTRVMQWSHDELTRNPENVTVLNAFVSAARVVDAYHLYLKSQKG